MHAVRELYKMQHETVFVTAEELKDSPDTIDDIKRSGKIIIPIPSNIANKINEQNKNSDENDRIVTTSQFLLDQKNRFNPTIIRYDELTLKEQSVYNKTDDILKLIGGKPKNILSIEITDKIYEFEYSSSKTEGLWEPSKRRVLIKRTRLSSLSNYAGTLLHECAHAISGAGDVSRDFEIKLTDIIGKISSDLIRLLSQTNIF